MKGQDVGKVKSHCLLRWHTTVSNMLCLWERERERDAHREIGS